MPEWHQLEPHKCEENVDAKIERACDYYNALMATEGGRRVLFDILHDLHFFDVVEDCPQEMAVARLVQLRTARRILARCGAVDQMEMIEALAGVAGQYQGEGEKAEPEPNLYDEQKLETD